MNEHLSTIINSLQEKEALIVKRVEGIIWKWQASRTCPAASDWHMIDDCRCRYFNGHTVDEAVEGLAAQLEQTP